MTVKSVVQDSVDKYNFQHISDLSRDEFIEMMVHILEEYPKTNTFRDTVWNIIPKH